MQEILNSICSVFDAGVLGTAGRIGRMVSSVPCNVKDAGDHYEISANISEYSKDEVSVTIKNGLLVISGERLSDTESENDTYLVKERIAGSFSRKFQLPSKVVDEEVKAKYDNGILVVTVPKVEKVEPPKPEEKKVDIE